MAHLTSVSPNVATTTAAAVYICTVIDRSIGQSEQLARHWDTHTDIGVATPQW